MHRRDFFKVGSAGFAALSVLTLAQQQAAPEVLPQPSKTWISGSPFLGHADAKTSFRNLSPAQIQQEIIHFRTDEPWRTIKLFGL